MKSGEILEVRKSEKLRKVRRKGKVAGSRGKDGMCQIEGDVRQQSRFRRTCLDVHSQRIVAGGSGGGRN